MSDDQLAREILKAFGQCGCDECVRDCAKLLTPKTSESVRSELTALRAKLILFRDRLRNPRHWSGCTTEIRAEIVEAMEAMFGLNQPPAARSE